MNRQINLEDRFWPHRAASQYIREYGYQHGDQIYAFMKKYDIGESTFGRLMDALGRHEACHRLYRHHLIYDFPFDKPEQIWNFLEHELADLFTKQGLPIIPGEILKHNGLLKYCNSLSHNWNFVNGFDILSGTLSIYGGGSLLKKAVEYKISIDTFEDFAKQAGIGALELAIALSTANPFLLLGAGLQLAGTIKGILNDSTVILFGRLQEGLTVEFALQEMSVEHELDEMSVETSNERLSVEFSSEQLSVETEIENDPDDLH